MLRRRSTARCLLQRASRVLQTVLQYGLVMTEIEIDENGVLTVVSTDGSSDE